jgi:predicted nucleic acid-binding Zn ribbon protein
MTNNTLQLKKKFELLTTTFETASPVEMLVPICWDESDKCSLAKCRKRVLNTAIIWNIMETFAILYGLNRRLNKHNKLAR